MIDLREDLSGGVDFSFGSPLFKAEWNVLASIAHRRFESGEDHSGEAI
jgi:hypothetical protein